MKKTFKGELPYLTIRGLYRRQMLRNTYQVQFDKHMGYRETIDCDWAFTPALNDWVSEAWDDTKGFMDHFRFRFDEAKGCMMAAKHAKKLAWEAGFDFSSKEGFWMMMTESGLAELLEKGQRVALP
jgi:hypothetical protein